MPTDACSKPSTNNYAADLGAGPARASCPQNRKSKLAVSASFAKNSFLLPRGERLQQFPAVRHRVLLPVGPTDYHFRYLLLIGEKERLGSWRHAPNPYSAFPLNPRSSCYCTDTIKLTAVATPATVALTV